MELPERLKGCDPVLVERIENDIIDRGDPITFEDIAGLAFAKKCVMELVCWPMARPDIFTVRSDVSRIAAISWMAEWP